MIAKKEIKAIKGMIGDREREITIREYKKCNDGGVRAAQDKDPKLISLYKLLEFHQQKKDV